MGDSPRAWGGWGRCGDAGVGMQEPRHSRKDDTHARRRPEGGGGQMVRLPGLPLQARRGCWSDGAPSRPTLTGRPQHSALVSALKCVLVSISEPPYNVLRSALNVLTPQVSAPLGALFLTRLALNLLSGLGTSGRECGAAQAGRGGGRTHCRHDTRCAPAAMMCGAPVCEEWEYVRRKHRCGALVCLGSWCVWASYHCGAGSTSLQYIVPFPAQANRRHCAYSKCKEALQACGAMLPCPLPPFPAQANWQLCCGMSCYHQLCCR